MPKKYTIEDLDKYIDEYFDNKIELLSDVYINCSTPLEFKCECGNTLIKPWREIQQGSIYCSDCSSKNKSNANTRKHTLEYVINYINDKGCEYISGDYNNQKSKLLIKCGCGELFEKDFEHFKRGQIRCNNCVLQSQSELWRKPFEQVLKEIEDGGCEYISGEYINNDSKLLLKCSCGKLFEKSMGKYLSGQNRCPDCGMKNLAESKRKYTVDEAYNKLLEHGYTMLNKEDYTWAYEPVQCLCKNGHECSIILSQLLHGRSGCEQCARDNQKGINSNLYIDGSSKINDGLRHAIKFWKKELLGLYNNMCPITGSSNVDVHHLLSFNRIFYDILDKYGEDVLLNDSINKLSSYDVYDKIKEEVIKQHTLDLGIVISKDVHRKFHARYGQGNNTPEQFNDFLQQFYHLQLSDIQIA